MYLVVIDCKKNIFHVFNTEKEMLIFFNYNSLNELKQNSRIEKIYKIYKDKKLIFFQIDVI